MVKKYVYGRPFETYAVVNAENVSDAAESEKRELFREADMKKALEPYGGITWDEPEDGNDAPAMQYRVRMSDGDVGEVPALQGAHEGRRAEAPAPVAELRYGARRKVSERPRTPPDRLG